MAQTIAERLQEFYRRLAAAPTARTADEAISLVGTVLDGVEDELSGIPKQVPPPPPAVFDGRMYPPEADSIHRTPEGGIVFRTRGHRVLLGADGSITIERATTRAVEFSKPGGAHD